METVEPSAKLSVLLLGCIQSCWCVAPPHFRFRARTVSGARQTSLAVHTCCVKGLPFRSYTKPPLHIWLYAKLSNASVQGRAFFPPIKLLFFYYQGAVVLRCVCDLAQGDATNQTSEIVV